MTSHVFRFMTLNIYLSDVSLTFEDKHELCSLKQDDIISLVPNYYTSYRRESR